MLPNVELAGRHVILTGAASGIGHALAHAFAAEGARLVLADIDGEAVAAVADELGAVAVRADVSRDADIVALVERARTAHGPVDLFFSNAGIGGPGGGPEAPDEEWQRTWEVNVMAHVRAARAVLPEMVSRGEGYIAATASAAGLLTQISAAAYSVTKHAAVAFAEWVAINYGDAGIRVSILCPQGVNTPMVERALAEDPVGSAPLIAGGLLEPDEVAEATVAGLRDERLLILPHPKVADYYALRAARPERWVAGMRTLLGEARAASRG